MQVVAKSYKLKKRLLKPSSKKDIMNKTMTSQKSSKRFISKREQSVTYSPVKETENKQERFNNGKKIVEILFGRVRGRYTSKNFLSKVSKNKFTLKELYKNIALKSHIIRVYVEVMQCPMGKPPDKIFPKDFNIFAKRIHDTMQDNDIKDAFYFLSKTTAGTAKENTDEKQYVYTEQLGKKYDEYIAKNENLKGVLNVNTLKLKNYQFQQKVIHWKENPAKEKEMYKNYENKAEFILRKLKEQSEFTLLEKQGFEVCISDFRNLLERKKELWEALKVIMKFLSTMTLPIILSIKDLKVHLEKIASKKAREFSLLEDFIVQIKSHSAFNGHTFSLYDIPDVILKMHYTAEEYNLIIKFTNKIKDNFTKTNKGMADNSLIPLSFFNDEVSRMKYIQDCKKSHSNKLILNCEDAVKIKKDSLNASTERVMQIVECNIFIHHLNDYLDSRLTDLNLCLFIIKKIHNWMKNEMRNLNPSEILVKLKVLMKTSNKDLEFIRVNALDLDKFNLRVRSKSKTTSEVTNRSIPNQTTTKEVIEAIDILNNRQPIVEDEGLLLQEVEVKEGKNEYFKNSEGEVYDPKEKFGTLEKDYTEYDPHMTKYEAVLPENYYIRTINKQSPSKKEQWFIRPHHVETLTKHPYSKWDNLLNTKYYSFYEKQGEKKKPENKEERIRRLAEDAIESIGQQINQLKEKEVVKETRGKSLSFISRRNTKQKVELSISEVKR